MKEYLEYVKCMEYQEMVPMTFKDWCKAKEAEDELKTLWSVWVD